MSNYEKQIRKMSTKALVSKLKNSQFETDYYKGVMCEVAAKRLEKLTAK